MAKPTKTLIVDDEPAIVDMLAFTIEQGGFPPLMPENTHQANAIMQRNRLDLVLIVTKPKHHTKHTIFKSEYLAVLDIYS